jgi:hypothetical protein
MQLAYAESACACCMASQPGCFWQVGGSPGPPGVHVSTHMTVAAPCAREALQFPTHAPQPPIYSPHIDGLVCGELDGLLGALLLEAQPARQTTIRSVMSLLMAIP